MVFCLLINSIVSLLLFFLAAAALRGLSVAATGAAAVSFGDYAYLHTCR